MNTLYICCGIPFSGKSTLAKQMVSLKGFTHIDLDEIKFELFGQNIKDDAIDKQGWDRIYMDMYQRIKNELEMGNTVIHDTGNFTLKERNRVRNIADKLGIPAITIYVQTKTPVAKKRLLSNRTSKERFDVSDKDFESTVKEMEPPTEAETHLVYTPSDPMDEWIHKHIQ